MNLKEYIDATNLILFPFSLTLTTPKPIVSPFSKSDEGKISYNASKAYLWLQYNKTNFRIYNWCVSNNHTNNKFVITYFLGEDNNRDTIGWRLGHDVRPGLNDDSCYFRYIPYLNGISSFILSLGIEMVSDNKFQSIILIKLKLKILFKKNK